MDPGKAAWGSRYPPGTSAAVGQRSRHVCSPFDGLDEKFKFWCWLLVFKAMSHEMTFQLSADQLSRLLESIGATPELLVLRKCSLSFIQVLFPLFLI